METAVYEVCGGHVVLLTAKSHHNAYRGFLLTEIGVREGGDGGGGGDGGFTLYFSPRTSTTTLPGQYLNVNRCGSRGGGGGSSRTSHHQERPQRTPKHLFNRKRRGGGGYCDRFPTETRGPGGGRGCDRVNQRKEAWVKGGVEVAVTGSATCNPQCCWCGPPSTLVAKTLGEQVTSRELCTPSASATKTWRMCVCVLHIMMYDIVDVHSSRSSKTGGMIPLRNKASEAPI